jgi:hypothetical protein
MRHEINIPDALPVGVCRFRASVNSNPGIRAEKVCLPISLCGLFNQAFDFGFDAHINSDGKAIYFLGDRCRGFSIEVCDDHAPRAFHSKSATQRATNSGRAACYDCNFVT